MYTTEGVNTVATITELRADTSDLVDYVRETGTEILIQKNNEPQAILMSWDRYLRLKKKINLNNL